MNEAIDKRIEQPYYDHQSGKWKLDLSDDRTEEGDLTYIACEYLRTSLYYPFHDGKKQKRDFEPHAHSFSDLLQHLMNDPKRFSVEGYEEYYSAQELELINAFQRKLLDQ